MEQEWAPTQGALVAGLDCGAVRVVETRHPAGTELSSHAHAHASVTFVLAGQMRECVNGRWIAVEAGDLLVKPAGAEHENAYGPVETHSLIVDFPKPVEFEQGLDEATKHTGCSLIRAATVLRAFRERSLQLPLLAEELMQEVVTDLDSFGRVDAAATPWLQLVRDRIEHEFAPPPRLADLAREAGVHPGYLARAFRSAFGCSIGELARRRQLAVAVESLATGSTLSEAALAAGFYDQAHLGRVLRKKYQCTPGWLANSLPPLRFGSS